MSSLAAAIPVLPPLPLADTQSANVVDANLAQLKTLFPDAFKEGGIDFEVLKQLLGDQVDEREEKYGLNWHGKRRARQIALTPSTGTLRPCPGESVDWDTTQNLMIEGDNLEVLKLLQKSYAGKVKMIYIDPPYNTGKDFVYPDNFTDNIKNYLELTGQTDGEGRKLSSNTEASGRFHTDWLNMMYPRLKLARNLLREDGVIFISLDDGEVANLRQMLDDVFGAENFVATIIWEKKFSPQNDDKYLTAAHDYVVLYAKSIEHWEPNLLTRTADQISAFSNLDDDPRGVWSSGDLTSKTKAAGHSYEIISPTGRVHLPPSGRQWAPAESTFNQMLLEERIWFGKSGNNFPRAKQFLSEIQQGIVPLTLWKHEQVGHTQQAKQEFNGLMDRIDFETPKPVQLIDRMLHIAEAKSSEQPQIILDFFAGSGSTGQAVYERNQADLGRRKFVLVQLPEPTAIDGYPTIADITKERLRRAAIKIRAANADKKGASGQLSLQNEVQAPPQPLDLGFKVFKLDTSNIRAWNPNPDELADTLMAHTEHLAAGRSEADVLYEVLLKQGLDLAIPIASQVIAGHTVHSVGAGALLVCLAQHASASIASSTPATDALNAMRQSTVTAANAEALALGIANWHTQLAAALGQTPAELHTRVVLRDSLFADDVAKTNTCAILAQRGLDDVRSL